MKMPVSYQATKLCKRLTDYFGKKDEIYNIQGTDSERKTTSSDEGKTPFDLYTERNETS